VEYLNLESKSLQNMNLPNIVFPLDISYVCKDIRPHDLTMAIPSSFCHFTSVTQRTL
jgi:hypothetical protein